MQATLLPNLPAKIIIQIEAADSAKNPNIQIADWLCGALFRYYNNGKNGRQYFSTFKNSIVARTELFDNYWVEFYKNKKSS